MADAHPAGAILEIAHSPRRAGDTLAEPWALFELTRTIESLDGSGADIREEIRRGIREDVGEAAQAARERRRKAVERALEDHRRLQEELSRRHHS